MDVSGWTTDQRMRLPDWCFGNRQLVSVRVNATSATSNQWGISTIVLPDPVCIWEIMFEVESVGGGYGYFRIGLAHVVPTSQPEMNLADDILPDYGLPYAGPKDIFFLQITSAKWKFKLRKGMATGGKKLVVENSCTAPDFHIIVSMTVSGLPTSMAGWLAHNK